MTFAIERTGAILSVDLDAVVSNWRALAAISSPAQCAAVVKADAYGLGAMEISQALETAGCRNFFVAHLEEGMAIRRVLATDTRIFVLNGTPWGTHDDFVTAALVPVVNTRKELSQWSRHALAIGKVLPVAVHIDSGMTRLGFTDRDVELAACQRSFSQVSVELILSHLACADQPNHPMNERQRIQFDQLRKRLPMAGASIANSSGIFLGSPFHFDVVRAGAALFGINPTPNYPNPMRNVVCVRARVIQVSDVEPHTGVGYGHIVHTKRRSRLATISLGYADGWPRNAAGTAIFRGQKMPFVGRVSMDSIVVDVTDCPEPPGRDDFVEIIGCQQTLDDVGASAGTIGYEILTRLGSRFSRCYIPVGAKTSDGSLGTADHRAEVFTAQKTAPVER